MNKASQITQSDKDYAKALIQRASPALAKLLDAKEVEGK